MNNLGFYKLDPEAKLPTYGTAGSACFDFYARVLHDNGFEYLYEGETKIFHTGLIAQIPEGYSLRIHPRSGLAFNYDVSLINCEGIVDSDFCDEIKIKLVRHANPLSLVNEPIKIHDLDRIAQGELVKNETVLICEIADRPSSTSRSGGFGSTGR